MSTFLLFSLIIGCLFTTFSIWFLKPYAPRFGLIDTQDHRKKHVGDVPLIGGIAMFLGVLMSSLIILPTTTLSLTWLFTSACIVLLGVLDDALDLSVRSRLLIQALLTITLSVGTGYSLMSLGNLFGFGDISLGSLGYLLTAIAVIGAINAFNMMDGIDGLAGIMALVSFGGLAILFGLKGDNYGLYISLIFLAVLLPYLANNLLFPPYKHKIFMGDAGAMMIGFSVVWLLMYGSQSHEFKVSFRPVTALWIIAIPLLDMIAIIFRRLKRGESPFKADRDHLHHILLDTGLSHRKTLLLITMMAIASISFGVTGEIANLPESIMLIGFFILVMFYQLFIRKCRMISREHKMLKGSSS